MTVSQAGGNWVFSGKKHRVTINASDLTMKIDAGPVTWSMPRSLQDDMLVKSRGEECYVRLAEAGKLDVERYDTGFKTGVKISLSRFRHNGLRQKGAPLDLTLYLTAALEGDDEELAFDISAAEGEAVARQLDWPKEIQPDDPDYTLLA